ncbi:uncharacterized protein LOC115451562 isoform X2 [Manduca sexta]|uniref:uncharacterized protein LOC115451562 isoform X2 n=2 Tax=Manduca sexta TaxID=7130 RepID=UPI0018901251|nr:uncharacterized protein LOC115451562 isoform X2 [Manduca sexta]
MNSVYRCFSCCYLSFKMASKFLVVKYLTNQYGDRYAFVPDSWVVSRRETDNIIVIYYPAEHGLAVEHRVRNKETPAPHWTQRVCEQLCIIKDYNEAKTLTMKKNRDEYTRLTLRHTQPGPGLVELVENTDVYVVKDQLQIYTKAAPNSRALIRTLLTLVFTDFALSSCVLTRKTNKLDCGALDALFSYVNNVVRRNGWVLVDDEYFDECVRQKLRELL